MITKTKATFWFALSAILAVFAVGGIPQAIKFLAQLDTASNVVGVMASVMDALLVLFIAAVFARLAYASFKKARRVLA